MSTPLVCFDIGSDTLKMAVLSADKDALRLEDFAVVNLAVPPDTPVEERHAVVAQTVRFMLDERKLRPKAIHISLSGQAVFVRFVKLPAVEESKVAQIVRYEAQQQVPFPIDEVEWDHQVIGDTRGEEIDIVLVAIKTEVVSGLIEAIRKQHIEVETVDVSSLALYNAMIYNEGPFDTSTACVDLGARTTDLIIAEGIRLWSRSIPIGGENFTQAIAKELDVSIEEADKLKRLVAVGPEGAAPAGDEMVRRASDAVVKVLNRLLAEVRRSIGYYRTQSQGSAVQRLLISGGGSFVKGIDAFLAAKLNVEVHSLSPLAKLTTSPKLDAGALRAQGRLLGDVIGLGLRAAGRGLMKVNLIPKAIVYQRELSKKKVFIVGAAACLIGAVVLWGLNARTGAAKAGQELDELTVVKNEWERYANDIGRVEMKLKTIQQNVAEIEKMREARLYWVDFIDNIKKEKPSYAWFTSIYLEGIEDPSHQLDRVYSSPSTRMPTNPGYAGSMAAGGGSSMPSATGRVTNRPTPRGPTTPAKSAGGGKPKVVLQGYLKITRNANNPEGLLARQVDNLRAALEANQYFSNVVVLDQHPIPGSEKYGEPLAMFTFEASLDVPIQF